MSFENRHDLKHQHQIDFPSETGNESPSLQSGAVA